MFFLFFFWQYFQNELCLIGVAVHAMVCLHLVTSVIRLKVHLPVQHIWFRVWSVAPALARNLN